VRPVSKTDDMRLRTKLKYCKNAGKMCIYVQVHASWKLSWWWSHQISFLLCV